ncbi:MAG: glycosyltransferase [Ignavibacteriaceae bacterium]|nr:glycosyltransferase [Ignavibacteriaceae bacterium]
MKRVCMISQSGYNDPRVRRQAQALADAGYEVDILGTSMVKGEDKLIKSGSITFFGIIIKQRHESIIRYGLHSFHFFFKVLLKLQYLSLLRRYDLIQVHNMPEYHVFTAIFQKFAGIPIVLDLHDLTPELFECKWANKKNASILNIVKYVERISCSFANKLITVNSVCKDNLEIRGIAGEKITLVLNTPNQKIFKHDPGREYRIISNGAKLIYHGTVGERFGLHIAVEAMKYLNEKIPGSILTIYGQYDRSYRIYLEELIKKFNLEENIFLKGTHSQEIIYGMIKESDFGIVPYTDNLYMNLCLSTKMFEYNASLLPVVASRLKAPSMIFGDDSIGFITPDKPIELAEKVIELCCDPAKRKAMAASAYTIIQSISGQIMSARYLNLIESTINRN